MPTTPHNNKDSNWLANLKNRLASKKGKHFSLPTFHTSPVHGKASSEAMGFIRLQLGHVVLDTLRPYYFNNADFASYVAHDLAYASLSRYSVSAADVLINFFLESSSTYHQLTIDGYSFITKEKMANDGLVAIGNLKIKPSKSLLIKGFNPSPYFVNQLCQLYSLMQNINATIATALAFSQKTVITVDGLHNAFNALHSESELTSDELLELFTVQAKNIASPANNIAMIDSSISLNNLQVDLDYLGSVIEFLYGQLAMLLGLPQSKLAGRSPSGLNSSGQLESEHYNAKLESLRKVLEDFCSFFALSYNKKESLKSTDSLYLEEALGCLQVASTLPNLFTSNELEELKNKLLGYYIKN